MIAALALAIPAWGQQSTPGYRYGFAGTGSF